MDSGPANNIRMTASEGNRQLATGTGGNSTASSSPPRCPVRRIGVRSCAFEAHTLRSAPRAYGMASGERGGWSLFRARIR